MASCKKICCGNILGANVRSTHRHFRPYALDTINKNSRENNLEFYFSFQCDYQFVNNCSYIIECNLLTVGVGDD